MAVKGFVYFCPDLRLYRYMTEGEGDEGVDYKFNDEELEDALVALLSQETEDPRKAAEAKFLANMTGLARTNPHKIVAFNTEDDKIDVLESGPFWAESDARRKAAEEADAG